jgi:predicted nucleic acid-binding protein
MPGSVLLDAGPLVAFLRSEEENHDWAAQQFKRFPRFTTCEAVLAEACARLNYYGEEQNKVIELVRTGAVVVNFDLNHSADRVSQLLKKYSDQPMDLADACLVSMTEKTSNCLVVTLDHEDFSIYRRQDRHVIPFISPKS